MAELIDLGLVSGCTCGCRGDFRITMDGLRIIDQRNKIDDKRLESIASQAIAGYANPSDVMDLCRELKEIKICLLGVFERLESIMAGTH